MSTQPIPIFDPQGILRDVPPDQLATAVKAGGMPAVKFLAPDKTTRFVPANRTQEAYKAGGTIQPFAEQPVQHPGFWASLYDDITSMPGKIMGALTADDPMTDPNLSEHEKMQIVDQRKAQMDADVERRKAQGYNPVYREVLAPGAEMMGLNIQGAEQSAGEGDSGGVVGHLASTPVAAALTEGAARAAMPRIPFALKMSRALDADPEVFAPPKAAPVKASATTDLDATEENVPFAGEKPPKTEPWYAHDATGENKVPFAGGLDEWNAKLSKTRPLSDLNSEAVAQAQAQAAAPQPAPESAPEPAPKPKVKAAPKAARASVLQPSGDPILDALRQKAAKIRAEGFPSEEAEDASAPDMEGDLMGQLLESLKPENLAKLKARKAAVQ